MDRTVTVQFDQSSPERDSLTAPAYAKETGAMLRPLVALSWYGMLLPILLSKKYPLPTPLIKSSCSALDHIPPQATAGAFLVKTKQKNYKYATEIAQWIKHLLNKKEDRSVDPRRVNAE